MIIEIMLFFVLGLVLGSFLNSWLYRSHKNLSLWGRSFCPGCEKQLLNRDLIPLLSFLFLKGKCRFCQKKINWQYFIVELVTGLLFALVFWHYQILNLFLLRDLVFVIILLFVLIYDWQHYLILDKVIWPSLVIAVIFNLILNQGILNLILGMLILSCFFLLQYLLSKGAWVGLGDVKFGLILGAMLGWQLGLLTLIISYLLGGVVAIILLGLKNKKFGDVLPMGTFLGLAAIIALLWGDLILKWYF